MFDGVGVVGAWAIHEFVEVVRQALLGLLAHAVSCGDQHGVVRSAPILLFFLPLCVEGPLSWSTRLALPLSWPPLKTAPTASSREVWLVATSSRSRVVWGFRQQSLWIRDSQVIPERNALMTSTSMTSGRELRRWENLWM